MSAYSVTVNLTAATAKKIAAQKLNLFAFKGAAGPKASKFTVWFKVPQSELLAQNKISWSVAHKAYIAANASLVSGTNIDSVTPCLMEAGQIANVTADGTIALTSVGGFPGKYTISNQSNVPYICGIGNVPSGTVETDALAPIVAAPLNGLGVASFIPKESVFLTFSDQMHDVGAVYEMSTMPGVVVDLTFANSASVIFDIDNGWTSAKDLPNCTPVPSLTAFADMLNVAPL